MKRRPVRSRLPRLVTAAASFLIALAAPSPSPAQQMETMTAGTVRAVYAPRHRALARQVLAAARTPVRFPGLGAVAVPESTTIVLAPDARAFAAATGGGVPEWAGGVAIPEWRRIVLPQYAAAHVRDDEQGTILRHEIAHLVLHDRLPGDIPRWFDEGYAEVASGGWDVEGAWQLRWGMLTGAVPPLDSLAMEWPRHAADARTAYLLSATAVDYLRRRGGERGMELLLANWREEGSFDQAVRTTFGITAGQLEDEWRADVRNRYGWLAMLTNVALIWLAATILVLAAWIPRRRRNRQRLALMDAEERMLPPPRPEMAGVEYPLPEPPD
ncbi:MAG TPA: peptidase MA family metallohydrolase [Longimicrobium sp.]|nr:peptidase MA family metallohydrolase [Longimicrobium sp.]